MFENSFGIEIEFTGITRKEAARVVAEYLGVPAVSPQGYYNTIAVRSPDTRVWKLMSDGSILCQKKQDGRSVSAGSEYSVELVSPILTYREDIATLQEIVRSCGKPEPSPTAPAASMSTWTDPTIRYAASATL